MATATLTSAPPLPDWDAANTRVADLGEFIEREIHVKVTRLIARFLLHEGNVEVTAGDVGRLWSLIDYLGIVHAELGDEIEKLRATLRSLDAAREEGRNIRYTPCLNKFGRWTEEFDPN